MAVVDADLDADGLSDYVVLTQHDLIAVYQRPGRRYEQRLISPRDIDQGNIGEANQFQRLLPPDLTGDGFPDLAISGQGQQGETVFVFLNDGTGGFLLVDSPLIGEFLGDQFLGPFTAGDFTGDGMDDLAALTFGQLGREVRLLTFDLSMPSETGVYPFFFNSLQGGVFDDGLEAADLDGNGADDLILVDNNEIVVLGTRPGFLAEVISTPFDVVQGQFPSIETADMTGDGVDDFLIVEEFGELMVSVLSTQDDPGRDELVLVSEFEVMRQSPEENLRGFQTDIGDIDGDGDNDVVLSKTEDPDFDDAERLLITLLNDGNGTLSPGPGALVDTTDVFPAPGFVADSPFDLAALADSDSDGDLDLVYGNESDIFFIDNDGTGVFAARDPELAPTPIAFTNPPVTGLRVREIADLDNDGFDDIILSWDVDGTLFVLRGTPSGFQSLVIGMTTAPPSAIKAADLDRDGDLDVVCLVPTGGTGALGSLAVLGNQGGLMFSFTELNTPGPRLLEIADFRPGGDLEIAVLQDTLVGDGLLLFESQPPSGYVATSYVVDPVTDSMTAFEANGDAFIDLVFDDTVFLNFGGAFGTGFSAAGGVGTNAFVTTGDFRGIGSTELLTLRSRILSILAGAPLAPVIPTVFVSGASRDAEVADFDGDGDIDLVATDSFDNLIILLNNGDGTFEAPTTVATGFLPFGSLQGVGDFNGDGRDDLVFETDDGLVLVTNRPSAAAFWTNASDDFFDNTANWSPQFLPGTGAIDVALFEESRFENIGGFGVTPQLTSDVSFGALALSSGDVGLLPNGFDIELLGFETPAGPVGLEIGALTCDSPAPTAPRQLRFGNTSSSPSTLRTPITRIGLASDATLDINATSAGGPTGATSILQTSTLVVGDHADGELRLLSPFSKLVYGDAGGPGSEVLIGASADGTVRLSPGATAVSANLEGGSRGAAPRAATDRVVLGRDPGVTGTLEIDGGTWRHSGGAFVIGEGGRGEVRVTNNGLFDIDSLGSPTLAQSIGSSALVELSDGSAWVQGGTRVIALDGLGTADIILQDGASIDASTLRVGPNASVSGSGTLAASINGVLNFGRLAPESAGGSSSPGVITINGDYTQVDDPDAPELSGRVEIRLLDVPGAPSVDRLLVNGRARLAGGLSITGSPGTLLAGTELPAVVTATEIDAEFPSFDVISSPIFIVEDGQTTSLGTLVPSMAAGGRGASSVMLEILKLDELLFAGSEFTPDGAPNDAVLGDVTGDGIDDLAIAVPSITGSPNGAIALLRGDTSNGFTFVAVDLYLNGSEVDGPTSVEIGDFDADGTNEIAFASGGDAGVNNDVHVIEFNGLGLVDSTLPAFAVADDSRIVDLASSSGFFAAVGTELAILEDTSAVGSSRVNLARFNSTNWDFCPLPVDDDDPDAVDPIDTDGPTSNTYLPGVAVTSRGKDRLTVFVAELADASPDDWGRVDFATGAGPRDVRANDLDGDGVDDLVVINQTAGTLSVLRTRGGGDIAPPVEILASSDPVSLSLVDVDEDGDRDVAIVASNGTDRVVRQLRNTTQAAGSITLAAAQDIPDQPSGTPVLIRSSDLDGSNGVDGVEDDLVILVEPGAARGGEGMAMNAVRLSRDACPADTNGDGLLSPGDFNAWVLAFNAESSACDQNNDGLCTPGDFNAWILNFNAGCE
ncbi:MAG: VCBS repeat-containing protein [Planctomycetota bacterium]